MVLGRNFIYFCTILIFGCKSWQLYTDDYEIDLKDLSIIALTYVLIVIILSIFKLT